jgi:hypothetical protein
MEENNDGLYNSLLDVAQIDRRDINRELLKKKLNVKPLKSKYMVYESCFIWQSDLKHVPKNASGMSYILVCVDVATRKCDAEPLLNIEDADIISKNTLSLATLVAYGDILERGLICGEGVTPHILYVDGGAEFEGAFKRAVKKGDTKIRTTVRGRKQQNAIVEHVNGLIGFGLMSNAYRLRTEGLPPNAQPRPMESINIFSANILPRIITKINAWASTKFPLAAKNWFQFDFNYPETDLNIGDYVYIPKLYSDRIRKRYGQHNYLNIPFQITNIFTPTLRNEPYRFMTSFSDKVTFKRDEIIKSNDFTHNNPIIEFG